MKQKRAFEKIDRKIYLVFLIVIAIAIINAVISTLTIRRSHEITSDIVNNSNPSLDALAKMNLVVTRSRMLITNWVYLPNSRADKDSLFALNNNEYIQLRGRIRGLMPYWKNEAQTTAMAKVFTEYEEITEYELQITRLLNNFDDYRDPSKHFAAEDILERKIIPRSEDLSMRMKVLNKEQTAIALNRQDQMLYQFNSLTVLVLGLALLIICSILFAAMVITRSIIYPILHVRNVIMQIGKGELPELKMKIPNNAVGEMLQALRFLIDGFRQTSRFVEEIGKGNFDYPFQPLSEKDVQGHALITMRNQLNESYKEDAARGWINEGLSSLNAIMRSSNDDFSNLLDRIIETIVQHLNVQQAAIFLLHNEDLNDLHIQLGSYYALNNKILNSKRYELKEGLIGQAISSNKIITLDKVYDPYFTIETGLGTSKQCSVMIIPLATSGKVVGAIEVASLQTLTTAQKELLERMAEPIAANIFSVRANLITSQLLEESRKQAEELVYQEQELRNINNELTKQSQLLQQSEEELKTQQEELKQVNTELQNKAAQLEEQNIAIEDARQSLSFKAEQLEQSNKYKSAFLANMSHELRTPLNSILILAKLLADNKKKNLEQKQIEHAHIIHKSGSDLLMLINDILDLSKIEAGKVDLQNETVQLKTFSNDMKMLFSELAIEKQIHFNIHFTIDEQEQITTDKGRAEQIIKNLLSNAFKFTTAGGEVEMTIGKASPDVIFKEKSLLQAEKVICITVKDSGIGIAEDKQKLIFEAFQQADGSTSRKFGGTGLGLAICKELAHMMGGEITLESVEGAGSTFSFYLPFVPAEKKEIHPQLMEDSSRFEKTILKTETVQSKYQEDEIRDDRTKIKAGDKVILIVEDDYVFARMLMNQCHKYNFKAIIALQGDQGLQYASTYHPFAIILDMRLPVMDGWTVLKKLKEDDLLKNIPVHIISSVDKKQLGIDMGATTFLNKPAGREEMEDLFNKIGAPVTQGKKLLFFGERTVEIEKVLSALKSREERIEFYQAENINDCISLANKEQFQCMIIDSGKDENTTRQLVLDIRSHDHLRLMPLVFCADNPDECLREVEEVFNTEHLQVKENVLDEAGIFLDTVSHGTANFTHVQNRMNELLHGKNVLIVDDDMRNIYSITNVLENEGLNVICAYDGLEALEKLEQHDDIDIVLMDIMMPNMNGYEAIQQLRKNNKWNSLPVIAVTAKAMSGDREKCMEAGASDYLTKPINTEQLLSLMRVWLYK